MKILISGASGMVGSFLLPFFLKKGGEVTALVRRPVRNSSEIQWDPAKGEIDSRQLEEFDAVVHLSGENIFSGRWTPEKKRRLAESRVNSAELLCQTLLKLDRPPQVVLSASAVGFYGNRNSEILHEESKKGKGFLADLAADWEQAWAPLAQKRIRAVNLRFGVILSPKGGALEKMLLVFKWGLGAVLGNGRQYFSWVHIDDVCFAIDHAIRHEALLRGPLNVVAPQTVTQKEFAKTLGRVLKKPVFVRAPGFALKMTFGREMAQELFLSSTRAEPARLIATDYRFKFPTLEGALKDLLIY